MGHKILVVDDEQEIRQFLDLVLRGKGYEVITARGGEEALSLARTHHPHLVLLDIMMPGMDGWAVLKRLRADGELAQTPVAMVSARTESRDRAHAVRDGAVDYIAKPFSLRDLLQRVEAILSRGPGKAAPPARDKA